MNTPKSYIAVIGGINIDIKAQSFSPLLRHDSNPGLVSASLGGVGFNAARNLGLMDTNVVMLTSLGDDRDRPRIEDEAARFNIDLSHAVTVNGRHSQTYLYICGPDGDMELAVNDMELIHAVNERYIMDNIGIINGAAAVVIDANLDEEAIRCIAENCDAPIFADPVSAAKADRIRGILNKLYALKPNLIEGGHLSGTDIHDRASLKEAAVRLCRAGVRHLFLSLGKYGCLCSYDNGKSMIIKPCLTKDIVNATGGGDAMTAAIVKGYLMGLGDSDTVSLALAASALTVECPQTVNPDLTLEKVMNRAGLAF